MSEPYAVIKTCPICQDEFISKRSNHTYCSRSCQLKARFIEHVWLEKPSPYLNIESELCLLTSDWHIPFDKPEYVDAMYSIAKELEIPDLVVIGDFWDCDNYSQYTDYNVTQTFQHEIALVATRLQQAVDFFENSYFCVGNHEARFLIANADSWRRGSLRFKQMMNLTEITEGYTVTDNRWMTLNNEWRLTHPKNYSQKKLRVARKLADKYHMNIINTHGHYTAGTPPGSAIMRPATHVVTDVDTNAEVGVYKVADIGGLLDKSKLEYTTIWDTVYPTSSPGLAIYDGGEVTVIDLEKYLDKKENFK